VVIISSRGEKGDKRSKLKNPPFKRWFFFTLIIKRALEIIKLEVNEI